MTTLLDKQRKQAETLDTRLALEKLPALVARLEKLEVKLRDMAYPVYTVTNAPALGGLGSRQSALAELQRKALGVDHAK